MRVPFAGHDWSKRCTFSLSCRPAANRVFAGPSRFGFPVLLSIFRRISFARPSRDKQLWRQYRFLLGRDAQFHGSASCDWASRSHSALFRLGSRIRSKSAFGSKILRCKHVGQFGWFHVLLKMVREFVRHLLWFGQPAAGGLLVFRSACRLVLSRELIAVNGFGGKAKKS